MKRILLGSLLGCMFISQQASAVEQNYILDEYNVVRRNVKREHAAVPHRFLDGLGQELDCLAYMTVGAAIGSSAGTIASLAYDCSLDSGLTGALYGLTGGMWTGIITRACVESLIKPSMRTYKRYAFKRDIMHAVASQDVIEVQKAISLAIDDVITNLWGCRNHTTKSLRSALQDEKALLDTLLEARLAADQIKDYTLSAAINRSIELAQITYCNRCNGYNGSDAHPLLYTIAIAICTLRGEPCLLPIYVYKNGHVINRLYCD